MPPTPKLPAGLSIISKADQIPQLLIYADIGPAWAGMIDATSVVEQLAAIGDVPKINVRINSGGGDCFEAFAIYNALARHRAEILVDIDALAASAASVIAMAGDTVRIAENAMLMIHQCWTFFAGNSTELRKTADLLDQIDLGIRDTYAARSGQTPAAIAEWMAAETWFRAAEAVEKGFCDEIGQPMTLKASVASGRYRNTPRELLDPTAPAPKSKPANEQAPVARTAAATWAWAARQRSR